jgi:hypothetical protein
VGEAVPVEIGIIHHAGTPEGREESKHRDQLQNYSKPPISTKHPKTLPLPGMIRIPLPPAGNQHFDIRMDPPHDQSGGNLKKLGKDIDDLLPVFFGLFWNFDVKVWIVHPVFPLSTRWNPMFFQPWGMLVNLMGELSERTTSRQNFSLANYFYL